MDDTAHNMLCSQSQLCHARTLILSGLPTKILCCFPTNPRAIMRHPSHPLSLTYPNNVWERTLRNSSLYKLFPVSSYFLSPRYSTNTPLRTTSSSILINILRYEWQPKLHTVTSHNNSTQYCTSAYSKLHAFRRQEGRPKTATPSRQIYTWNLSGSVKQTPCGISVSQLCWYDLR